MSRFIQSSFVLLLLLSCQSILLAEQRPVNVVYIMVDELGYYEPSFMGNLNIQTPNLDRLAAEGIRFDNLFGGSSVCAPTRCCFLTGKHSGHTSVRSNGGGTPLRADEETIASMLKQKNYATGGFGKWGCGGRDSTGVPEQHGFDIFLGYYDQVHAHSYYPPYLIRNSEEVPLQGNHGLSDGETYSQYVIYDAAVDFIRQHQNEPFFCYLPITPPHGLFDIPDSDPAWSIYQDKPWPENAKRYAAMVTMVDRQTGEICKLLEQLGLAENTLVFFSGDNGGADYFSSPEYPRGFHGANKHPVTGVEFRGKKGNLYEGGLRIPGFAYWPGQIAPGGVSDHLCYFPDILPTIAEVTGTVPPSDIDGISILPTLIGEKAAGHPQAEHDFLYWEIGGSTAIRKGNLRAVKPANNKDWELYDLSSDPSEANDLAALHPDELKHLISLADSAHQPVREGTFTRTDRHERDRRAKFGKQDERSNSNQAAAANSIPVQGSLKNDGWKIASVSSENTANNKYAVNAIDGDGTTVWHTRFSDNKPESHPHQIVIDLGKSETIAGVWYLARQDSGWNGTMKEVEVLVGSDPNSLGDPVATVKLEKTRKPQAIRFATVSARYVCLRALSEANEGPWASAAEIGFIVP